jgi:hypothetical protein
MSTDTKLTLAEMVTEALRRCENKASALRSKSFDATLCFPKSLEPVCILPGVFTSWGMSHVLHLAAEAKRPLSVPLRDAADWLIERDNYEPLYGLQRFHVQPSDDICWGVIGGAALRVEDCIGNVEEIDSCLYPSEIEHEWKGCFEFWAVRSDWDGAEWVFILPEEY